MSQNIPSRLYIKAMEIQARKIAEEFIKVSIDDLIKKIQPEAIAKAMVSINRSMTYQMEQMDYGRALQSGIMLDMSRVELPETQQAEK